MANEFIEIIKLVGELIWWILERLADIVLVTLLIMSNLFPWRLIESCNIIEQSNWREYAIVGFFLTIIDCICIPLGILSLASPFRWKHAYYALDAYDVTYGDMYSLRWSFVMMFMFMLLDVVTVPFAFLSFILPFRLSILFKELHYIYESHTTTNTRVSCDTYQSFCFDMCYSIISAGCSSIFDFVVFVPASFITLFSPTTWRSLQMGIKNCSDDYDAARKYYRFGAQSERPVRMDDNYDDYRWNLRVVFASQIAFAVNDILSLPFGIIALLSPFRHRAFRSAMAADGATWLAMPASSTANTATAEAVVTTQAHETIAVPNIEPSAPVKSLDVEVAENTVVNDTVKIAEVEYKAQDDATEREQEAPVAATANDVDAVDLTFSRVEVRTETAGTFAISHFNETIKSELHPMDYNISLRKHCFYYGTTAIIDFLLLPLLLPLLLTWYRLRPVKNTLFDTPVWSLHEFSVILQQFSFLLLDALFIPGGMLLFVTRIRWWPVQEAMKLDDLCSFRSLEVYGTITLQCILLIADVVVLPAICLLTVTYYRLHPVVVIWSNHHLWHDEDNIFYFHFTAVANFLLVLHDFIFIPVLFLLIFMSGLRFEKGKSLLLIAIGPDNEPSRSQNAPIIIHGNAPSAPPIAVAERISMPEIFPYKSWRGEVWVEAVNVLLDIPFYIMALFVILSVWRCKMLYSEYMLVMSTSYRVNSRRRKSVFYQFMYLIRDVLCLIPLSVVIGTLYRLPEVILGILSKLSRASRDDPVFDVVSARVECRERGGPRIQLLCRRNHHDVAALQPSNGGRLFATGVSFWNSVEAVAGSAAVSIGKSFLPLKLANVRHINMENINTYISEHPKIEKVEIGKSSVETDIEAPGHEISIVNETKCTLPDLHIQKTSDLLELWIEPDIGAVKRTTVLKKLVQLNQVECKERATGKSVVLVSISPTIGDLTAAFSLTRAELPPESLDSHLLNRKAELDSTVMEEGLVDSFWLIVLKSFLELCLDIAYVFLALFTIIAPWRWLAMMMELFEPVSRMPWRGMQQGMKYVKRSEQLFHQYVETIVPVVNNMSKIMPAAYTITNASQHFGMPIRRHEEEFMRIDKSTYVGYHKFRKEAFKRFSKSNDSDDLVKLVEEYFIRLERRMAYWAYITYFHIWAGNGILSEDMHNACTEYIHIEERKNIAAIRDLRQKMDVEMKRVDVEAHRSKKWGVWRKTAKDSRKIVLLYVKRACRDVAGLFMTMLLIITVIRFVPFLADLKKIGTCNVTRFSFRQVLVKHVRGIAEDTIAVAKFLFYLSLLCVLVVGLPSFLSDLPNCTSSLKEMTRCAKQHLKNTLYYMFEFVLMIFACRSVEITLRASLFSVLVPAACVAEGLPRFGNSSTSAKPRLTVGSIVWFGLLAASIAAVIVSNTAENEYPIRITLLAVLLALLGSVTTASLSLCQREEYLTPCKQALRTWGITWSHILAVLTGPSEALQLASVIMYFYWNRTDDIDKTALSFPNCSIGANNECGSWISFDVAVGLAVCCMLLWVMLVSLPLAFEDDQSRTEQLLALQTHSTYEMAYTIISRVLFVSIVATALRPYSCIEHNDTLVLFTDHGTECGDGGSWSGLIALPLLMYFIITSCILHSDAPEFVLREGRNHSSVQFAPMYALGMKMLQVAILILCFAGRQTEDDTTSLIIVIVLSGAMFVGAVAYGSLACSLPCINPLRAGGILAVIYTALLCYYHNMHRGWADQTALFIGWGCIFGVAAVVALYTQWRAYESWKLQLHEAGLGDAIAAIGRIADVLLTEEAVCDDYHRHGNIAKRVIKWRQEAENALSTYHLGRLLLKLEQNILFERLTLPFLNHIHVWRESFTDRNSAMHTTQHFQQLHSLANDLLASIKPRTSVNLVTRSLFALVMRKRLPVEISWEIFQFLVDTTQVKIVLLPLNFVVPFKHENKYHTMYSGTWQLFTSTAQQLDNVLQQIQILDKSIFGFNGSASAN